MQLSAQPFLDFLASQLLAMPDVTYAVGHNVGVAVQTPLGVSVRGLVASEVPDDQGLVAGSRQEHVGAAHKESASTFFRIFAPCKSSVPSSTLMYTYFSREVARDVTQPEWPSRVPRRTNCSAMLCGRLVTLGIKRVGALGGGVLAGLGRQLFERAAIKLSECGRRS